MGLNYALSYVNNERAYQQSKEICNNILIINDLNSVCKPETFLEVH
jgi:hypothetical protein